MGVRRSSTCMWQDPLTLSVYLHPETGKAEGRLYIDDYKTQQYNDGKSFLDLSFTFEDGRLRLASSKGALPAGLVSVELERVEIFGLTAAPTQVTAEKASGNVQLPPPVVRPLARRGSTGPTGIFAAVLKVSPWIE